MDVELDRVELAPVLLHLDKLRPGAYVLSISLQVQPGVADRHDLCGGEGVGVVTAVQHTAVQEADPGSSRQAGSSQRPGVSGVKPLQPPQLLPLH